MINTKRQEQALYSNFLLNNLHLLLYRGQDKSTTKKNNWGGESIHTKRFPACIINNESQPRVVLLELFEQKMCLKCPNQAKKKKLVHSFWEGFTGWRQQYCISIFFHNKSHEKTKNTQVRLSVLYKILSQSVSSYRGLKPLKRISRSHLKGLFLFFGKQTAPKKQLVEPSVVGCFHASDWFTTR